MTMNEPIPSPFSPISIEDEVFLSLQELCKKHDITAFYFMYAQNDDGNTICWRSTTNDLCEMLIDKLEESTDLMKEKLGSI